MATQVTNDPFWKEFFDAFNLKHVRSFKVEGEVGSAVTMTATFFPEAVDLKKALIPMTKRFEFVQPMSMEAKNKRAMDKHGLPRIV